MLPFIYYQLKVMICSGIMYCYYLLALRNKRFHQYNRWYLLSAVALSFIIPFIKIELWKETVQQSAVMKAIIIVNDADAYVEKTHFVWDWNDIAFAAFGCISFVFLLSLIVSVIKIFILINKHPKKFWENICFVFSNTAGTPFSFFKYIFWNKEIDIDSYEGQHILKHELAHVREKHTADKLFMSLTMVIGWYNPFLWLIRKELNIIHEFIADQKALSNGDAHSFAVMLLKATYPTQSFLPVNSFFHSPIKRRLVMLTTLRNPRYSYIRRIMVLPLLTVVILFFAFKHKEKKEHKSVAQHTIAAAFFDTLKPIPQFPGGAVSWDRYLKRNLDWKVGERAGAPKGSYKVTIRFNVDKEGRISNITPITNNGYGFEREAMNLIKKGPKWNPAEKDNKNVNSTVEQDFYFTVPGLLGSSKVVLDTSKKSWQVGLVILDGQRMTWKEFEDKKILRTDIGMALYMDKGYKGLAKYGEEGKNGVAIFTTKQHKTGDTETMVANQPEEQKFNRPLYYGAQIKPAYPGGKQAFLNYIASNLRYPEEAMNKKIEAPVLIRFVVDDDGTLTFFQRSSNWGYGLEEEAIRLIKNSGKWIPAKYNGKDVPCTVNQRIEFSIDK